MKTKDVLLVVGGVALGYFLFGFLNKSKDNTQTSTSSTEPNVNQAKSDCESRWEERAKSLKGTPEFIEKQKKAFISFCNSSDFVFTRDFGNGLIVSYKNDCNKVTNKCPIVGVSLNGISYTKQQGKYFKGSNAYDSRPMEISEKQWIDEAISKVPF